jgi:hypothetical protein
MGLQASSELNVLGEDALAMSDQGLIGHLSYCGLVIYSIYDIIIIDSQFYTLR